MENDIVGRDVKMVRRIELNVAVVVPSAIRRHIDIKKIQNPYSCVSMHSSFSFGCLVRTIKNPIRT